MCRWGIALVAVLFAAFPCMVLAKSPPTSVDEGASRDHGLVNALAAGKEPPPVQIETDVLVIRVNRSRLSNDAKLAKKYEKWKHLNPPSRNNPGCGVWLVEESKKYLSFVQDLRAAGLAQLVAETRLVSLNGRIATFASGSDQSVPKPVYRLDSSFRQLGMTLTVLPLLQDGGKILLKIELDHSELDPTIVTEVDGVAVPGHIAQGHLTTLEVDDGRTVGLVTFVYKFRLEESLPWLRDIPFLGSSLADIADVFVNETDDLVVLVTPHRIKNP